MAFSSKEWARISAGSYEDSVVLFAYNTADTLATVTASGYFNDASEVGGSDVIIVTASDGARILITSLSGTTINTAVLTDGNALAANSVDSDNYVDGSIDAEHLSSGLAPLYSTLYTTTGGGITETITVNGLQTTDIVIADMNTHGASPVSCNERRVSAANTLYLKFSGDPGNDHKLNIVVYRPLN